MVNTTQSVPSLPCLSFVADLVSHFVAHFVWCFVSHCISHFVSYFAPHLFPTVCLKLFQILSPTVLPTLFVILFPYCVALSLESSLLLGCDAPVKNHGWLIAAENSAFHFWEKIPICSQSSDNHPYLISPLCWKYTLDVLFPLVD